MSKITDAVEAIRKHGSVTAASKDLGIHRTSLYDRLNTAIRDGLITEEEVASYGKRGAPAQISEEILKETVRVYREKKVKRQAAAALGIPATTLNNRLEIAKARGFFDEEEDINTQVEGKLESIGENDRLKAKIRKLEEKLRSVTQINLTDEEVSEKILGLKNTPVNVPGWVVKPNPKNKHIGVPTLFLSDWHWGERVDPAQINYVNSFDMTIGKERARAIVQNTFNLLFNHLSDTEYPGIVLAFGGDMLGGDIHDELAKTNEVDPLPALVDLLEVLIWLIEQFADKFGKVFIPWVTGNHGRLTKKIQAKNRNFTNLDWLLGRMLAVHFEKDKRVDFLIPDGPDALYHIFGWRYLLSHGDQFTGGDGVIGAIGPIIRGDKAKRYRNLQIEMEYDTLLLGHWHQYIPMKRVIVNGSLKGYDEYANTKNFPFEPPVQALWLTHPDRGPNTHMSVFVQDETSQKNLEWVGWVK